VCGVVDPGAKTEQSIDSEGLFDWETETLMKRLILSMAMLAAAGCGTANSTAASSTSVGVFTTTDLVVGTGATANSGNTVSVNYAGWLYDTGKANGKGAQFDPGPGPISFVIGGGTVIQGFSQGVAGMRVGGQRRVIIPPELAYGSNPPAGSIIPSNATLVFDITLNTVQ
jgi:FKBP-type peptidyl-prolyl cis-trans isomerase FkpA